MVTPQELHSPIIGKKYVFSIPNLDIKNAEFRGCTRLEDGGEGKFLSHDHGEIRFQINVDPFVVYRIFKKHDYKVTELDLVEIDGVVVKVDKIFERTKDLLMNLSFNEKITLFFAGKREPFVKTFVCMRDRKKRTLKYNLVTTMPVTLWSSDVVLHIEFDDDWIESVSVKESSLENAYSHNSRWCTCLVLDEENVDEKDLVEFLLERVGSFTEKDYTDESQRKHQYEMEDAYRAYKDMKSGERRFREKAMEEEEEEEEEEEKKRDRKTFKRKKKC